MYEYTLSYKKSTAHSNADALSRLLLPDTVQSTPMPAETVLLMEQMEAMPAEATVKSMSPTVWQIP